MVSATSSIRNQSAFVPALVTIVGLFIGMTLGVALSYLPPIGGSTSAPKTPAFINTASKASDQVPKQPLMIAYTAWDQATASIAASASASALASASTPASDTDSSAAEAVVEPAIEYLNRLKNLTHDSKAMLGFFNPINLKRPTWGWSGTELISELTAEHEVFGASPVAAVDAAAQTASKPKQTAITTQKKRLVVALDPGHGGTDPGSEAHNGLVEKELTLDMAKRIQLFLSEIDNVDVIMTRTTDTGMSRQSRVNKIKATGADVVVSLHFNHLPQTDVNLVETFFADRHNVVESLNAQGKSPSSINLDYTNASKNLANIMHTKVYNEVSSFNDEVIDAGVKRDTLFVLTRSFTPGVLLELTCISNPEEAARLTTVEYRNQLAAAIADGLRDYLRDEHSEQFSELLANLDS